MSRKVYKVVLNDGTDLVSVFARESFQVKYPPGETVEKPNLFVFTKLEHAEMYSNEWEEWEIWEAETESTPRLAPHYVPDDAYLRTGHEQIISDFWEGTNQEFWTTWLHILSSPHGTYLVDDLKLIRRAN